MALSQRGAMRCLAVAFMVVRGWRWYYGDNQIGNGDVYWRLEVAMAVVLTINLSSLVIHIGFKQNLGVQARVLRYFDCALTS